jgi:[ribosomal protein S5]-alanine N-acetyltransferase
MHRRTRFFNDSATSTPMIVQGKNIYLKLLSAQDVTERYVSWLGNPRVTQYLESRWQAHTLNSVQAYVEEMNNSHNNFLFGMFLRDGDEHIGNIKIGNINWIHRYGDVGLMIGAESAWGKGFGSEAITLVAQYAIHELNLHKLIAGIYGNNIGSYKAFIKAGWREVGTLKAHRFVAGEYVDEWLMECVLKYPQSIHS